jgi:hypothetical protein
MAGEASLRIAALGKSRLEASRSSHATQKDSSPINQYDRSHKPWEELMKRPATIVPPLTPFTSDLRVDYDALAKGVDYVVEDCNATVVIAAAR